MSKTEELPKVLLRCMSRKDAEAFVKKGRILFGNPRKWIKYCNKNGNNRIGDNLEGIFYRRSVLEIEKVFDCDTEKVKDTNGYINYWRYNSLDLPVLCFYGIGKNNILRKGIKTLHHTQDIGYVDISYFKDFLNNSNYSLEDYEKTPMDEQKVVVIVYEPVRLVNLIKEKVKCQVAYDNIEYVDKSHGFKPECIFPQELFLKDKVYANQSEFRVVLSDPSIKKIYLGDISKLCTIEEMYFGKMNFAFQENNTFLYQLSREQKVNFYAEGFEQLVTLFLTLADLDYPLQRKTINDYQELINYAKPYFNKYGIDPYIDINMKTQSFNIKYTFENETYRIKFYEISNDLHKYNDKYFHEIATIHE